MGLFVSMCARRQTYIFLSNAFSTRISESRYAL